jgi:hypothetical protein
MYNSFFICSNGTTTSKVSVTAEAVLVQKQHEAHFKNIWYGKLKI